LNRPQLKKLEVSPNLKQAQKPGKIFSKSTMKNQSAFRHQKLVKYLALFDFRIMNPLTFNIEVKVRQLFLLVKNTNFNNNNYHKK